MRTVRIIAVSTLLATSAVVGPGVSVGGAPHAVKPSVQRVPMPSGSPVATAPAAAAASAGATTAPLEGLEATFVDGGTSSADFALAAVPAASASAAVVQRTIITRAQWGADESLRTCSSPDHETSIRARSCTTP